MSVINLQIINLRILVVDKYLDIRGIMLVYSLNIYLSGTGSGALKWKNIAARNIL